MTDISECLVIYVGKIAKYLNFLLQIPDNISLCDKIHAKFMYLLTRAYWKLRFSYPFAINLKHLYINLPILDLISGERHDYHFQGLLWHRPYCCTVNPERHVNGLINVKQLLRRGRPDKEPILHDLTALPHASQRWIPEHWKSLG